MTNINVMKLTSIVLLLNILHVCQLSTFTCPSDCTCLIFPRNRRFSFTCRTSGIEKIIKSAPNDTAELSLILTSMRRIGSYAFSSMTQLKEIFIQAENLQSIHEKAFFNLTGLTLLHIGDTKLTSSIGPVLFSPLVNLQYLHLHANQIRDLHIDAFKSLRKLKELELNRNEISSIPAGMLTHLTGLNTLSLTMNSIRAIDTNAFKGLTNLRRLFLSKNKISFLEPGCFAHFKALRTLHLNGNQLLYLDQDVFQNLTQLQTLFLSGNLLESLNGSLASKRFLTHLELSNNQFSTLTETAFSGVKMRMLKLDGNELDTVDNLLVNQTDLILLDISRNQLTSFHPQAFDSLIKLRTLKLNENQIASLNQTIFRSLKNLLTLRLDNNKLENISEKLFLSLKQLVILNLGENQIKSLQVDTFRNLHGLKNLNLSSNQLTETGFTQVPELRSLLVLYLHGNRLNASTIMNTNFSNLYNLDKVDIRFNRIICSCALGNFTQSLNIKYMLGDCKEKETGIIQNPIPKSCLKDVSNNEGVTINVKQLVFIITLPILTVLIIVFILFLFCRRFKANIDANQENDSKNNSNTLQAYVEAAFNESKVLKENEEGRDPEGIVIANKVNEEMVDENMNTIMDVITDDVMLDKIE